MIETLGEVEFETRTIGPTGVGRGLGALVGGGVGGVVGFAFGTLLALPTEGVSMILVTGAGGGLGGAVGWEVGGNAAGSLFDACTGSAAPISKDLENIAIALDKELYNRHYRDLEANGFVVPWPKVQSEVM